MINFQAALQSAAIEAKQVMPQFQFTINQQQKKLWKSQITGAYDLLFPHIHTEFPTRDEVFNAIMLTMQNHQSQVSHWGKKSYPTGLTTTIMQTEKMPNEIADTSGNEVRIIGNNINTIGYGT